MNCQKVRIGSGFAIICGARGLSGKQKEMLANQTLCIEKAKTIRERMQKWAEEAHAAELPILAREFDYLGKQLEDAIANQVRAFRDEALKP